jgi:hypothetical protein
MDQIIASIKSALKPVQSLYNKAFNANKYAAGIGLSVLITTALFFVMVILISWVIAVLRKIRQLNLLMLLCLKDR